MTHTHAKGQGQRSLGSKDAMYTDTRMDEADCIAFLASAVRNRLILVSV